jgi:hypothetical protein
MFPEYARIYKEQSLNTSRKALPKASSAIYFSRGGSWTGEHVLAPDYFEDVYAMSKIL